MSMVHTRKRRRGLNISKYSLRSFLAHVGFRPFLTIRVSLRLWASCFILIRIWVEHHRAKQFDWKDVVVRNDLKFNPPKRNWEQARITWLYKTLQICRYPFYYFTCISKLNWFRIAHLIQKAESLS